MRAPAPPSPIWTPAVADPSVQTQIACCGRDSRWAAASRRRTSAEVPGGRWAPASRSNSTEVTSTHGAVRAGSTGSIGAAMPATRHTSSPTERQPVTDCSLGVTAASATRRRGSSAGSALAFARNRAARMVRRDDMDVNPASAIRAWTGVERVQPVMMRAASRISLFRTSTWEGGAAGSHAAAACSRAPRT